MSDTQAIMKFEFLPNEILIECFEYLNATDIFHSFDFLNSRFSNLIRNIPLHLNIQHMKESTLVQFCIKILLNSQIKKQIISLTLSSNKTFDIIEILFSFFSLNEFSQLRSLTLLDLNENTHRQISSILPLLTNLRYFRFTSSLWEADKLLTSLPKSTIQTLSVSRLYSDLSLTHQFTSLINLTISRCSVKNLCHLFRYSPKLQYLTIGIISQYYRDTIDELRLINEHATHLKRLVINNFQLGFDFLEILLKQTPNLKLLMISADDNVEIIDACRWQRLITTSLPLLAIFKFKFDINFGNEDSDILDKFQLFQNDFWHQQHHWYTEYTFHKNRAFIYTVPYMSNQYEVTPYTKRFYNESINNSNAFKNVTDLTLFPEAITDTYQYHFPNVKSLRLKSDCTNENYTYPFLKRKHIQSLNMIINLCKLTHLDISSNCRLKSSSILLQLLQEAPYLSSLKISKNTLFSLFNNRELCECFKKMIKKLDVIGSSIYRLLDSIEVVKLCQIFSNIEQFWCNVGQPENLLFILNQLSKLSYMKVFSYRTAYFMSGNRWLTDHASELDLYSFTIECEYEIDYDDFFHYYDLDDSIDYDSDFD